MRMMRASLALTCAAALAGCVHDPWVRSVEEDTGGAIVCLERPADAGEGTQAAYAHPYALDVERLRAILGGLECRERGTFAPDRVAPVFTPEELDQLAPALATVLAKAGPTERLRFLSLPATFLGVFVPPYRTEGVLFVEPGERLNLAFSGVREILDPEEEDWRRVGTDDPCRIRSSGRRTLVLHDPAVSLRRDAVGDEYPLWVVVDLAAEEGP